ncbi:glycosyltransferase [Micromonospora tulbaghiae]|uniref:glycosyltransferase n=1 Tax=Micromonospora tulbaghiae TaxID=479978 RepID=UPI0033F419D5
MEATLVIPTYNSRRSLEACLLSLNHQRDPESFEVVVSDDGSTDGTDELVAKLDLKYELRYVFRSRTTSSSRAAARNAGVALARGEVIVMTDGDHVLAPDFVAEHLRCHRVRPDLVVLGHRNYLGPGTANLEALRGGFALSALPPVVERDEREVVMAALSYNMNNLSSAWHLLYTCNTSVRREHLLAVGGFDESFIRWGFEDNELGYRLRAHGLTFIHNPYSVAYHQHHPVDRDQQFEDWRHNLAHFVGLHPVPEVALQWGLCVGRYITVRDRELNWLETYLRFEYGVRAIHGRRPPKSPYTLITVTPDNLATAAGEVAKLASAGPVLVVDHTPDRELPVQVQTTDYSEELLYFKQPDAETHASVLDRFVRGDQPAPGVAGFTYR